MSDKQILNTKEAAELLCCSENSLKQSRGFPFTLMGATPPPYLKMGTKSVRYKRSTLIAWLDKLEERDCSPDKHVDDSDGQE